MSDTISRFAPAGSEYVERMRALQKQHGASYWLLTAPIAGILTSLKIAYESGYLATVTELIHADLFSDFIEMAQYLFSEGFKDPAAVIIGSVLEEHLRKLCQKHNIPTDTGGKPKKADLLNSELVASTVYSKLDQKSVTGWLDLRNKAAHGKYGEYTKEQVALLIQSIQDFMIRNPA